VIRGLGSWSAVGAVMRRRDLGSWSAVGIVIRRRDSGSWSDVGVVVRQPSGSGVILAEPSAVSVLEEGPAWSMGRVVMRAGHASCMSSWVTGQSRLCLRREKADADFV